MCCVLFILALLGYFAVGILAWSQGDPRKVIYPTDSRGQFCGQAGTPLEKKGMLFYFNIMKCASPMVLLEFQCPTTQMCVETCPDKFLTLVKAYTNKKDWDYYKTFCKEGVSNIMGGIPEILKQGLCPAMLTPSKPFTRRCFPALGLKGGLITVGNNSHFDDGSGTMRDAKDLVDGVKNATVVMEARQVVMKIFEDYTKSWYWILIGLVIAMLTSLLFIVLLRFLAGIMVWVMIVMEIGFQPDFAVYLQIRQTWLAFMIILAIVEVIIILLLIFLRKRILIAIALIKEASRTIGHVMCSLFYPIFTFLLLAIVIAYWANYSISIEKTQCPDSECLFAFYGGETAYHKYLIGLQFYNVFLFFWCANFVTALGQMTLAGAFASHYWAFKKPDDVPAFPVFSSLGRSLRVLLEYLDHKLKGAHNKCTKFLLCCLKCCFWCLEKCIKRRSTGITSAPRQKRLLPPHEEHDQGGVLDKVTDFLLFLGKLLIVGLVGIFAFFFFSGRVKAFEDTAPHLHYYWVPILDLERNDGSAERPYLMPENLRKVLNKKNKTEPAE
ncbi:hypothetical protein F7725_003892 [Dissostichus mawsoni]|uniref:Choline transporter-like protein n=1 Tax=Dissostichus mawsoni TaxID=36200 RepID=A0A7J5YBJ4_DISMA|nr:hypothetical protein F7725_003892 [Dissostichus mawsoni]